MKNRTKIVDGQRVFLCSDLHLGHKNILQYDNRSFDTIDLHDETILENWNSLISENDTVYFLGDWCFSLEKGIWFAEKCKGKVFFLKGNHDRLLKNKRLSGRFEWIKDYHELLFQDTVICLFHYELATWNQCHRGAIHFFGHSHQPYQGEHRKLNVGINLWNFSPIRLDKAVALCQSYKNKQHHSEENK